jgi:hypothetical protein
MSTPSQSAPKVSLRAFLLDQPDDGGAAGALGRSTAEKGLAGSALSSARHLTTSTVRSVDHEIGVAAAGLLSMDLGDVLVSGWRKYQALLDAARRTAHSPGKTEVLALATHRVTCTYSPTVDLLVDGLRVNTFEFEVTVTFDLTGLSAVVAEGNLVALSGGDCVVTGVLSIEGADLVQRQRRFDPRFIVPLHHPVPLLPPSDPLPPQQRVATGTDVPAMPERLP